MMDRLSYRMQRWVAAPHDWGVDDCVIAPLDWVSEVRGGGLDLAEDLRFTYDDFASAQRVHRFFTDPLRAAVEYLERRAGLSAVAAPVRGDVALFKWMGPGARVLPTAGICVAPGIFAARGGDGVIAARPDGFLRAWGVGYAGR